MQYQGKQQKERLIARLIKKIRQKGYSYATEKGYCKWVIRFIRFHKFKNESEIIVNHEDINRNKTEIKQK